MSTTINQKDEPSFAPSVNSRLCLEDNVPSTPVRENESSEDGFDQCSGLISGPVEL